MIPLKDSPHPVDINVHCLCGISALLKEKTLFGEHASHNIRSILNTVEAYQIIMITVDYNDKKGEPIINNC